MRAGEMLGRAHDSDGMVIALHPQPAVKSSTSKGAGAVGMSRRMQGVKLDWPF